MGRGGGGLALAGLVCGPFGFVVWEVADFGVVWGDEIRGFLVLRLGAFGPGFWWGYGTRKLADSGSGIGLAVAVFQRRFCFWRSGGDFLVGGSFLEGCGFGGSVDG